MRCGKIAGKQKAQSGADRIWRITCSLNVWQKPNCQPPGDFLMVGFEELATGQDHVALVYGDISGQSPVLARVHSECLTGDALFSLRCDCGFQLEAALSHIAEEGRGSCCITAVKDATLVY